MKTVLKIVLLTLSPALLACNSYFSDPTPMAEPPSPPTDTPEVIQPLSPSPEAASETGFTPSGVADLAAQERADYYSAKPEISIDTNRTYQATIKTSKGDIVVMLDATAAPEHVNNFVFLSRDGFYNGLTFHRVEPGFVIQGGDPLGMGNGGPGYTIPGEFSLTHVEGAIAMARLPDQVNPERASSGSQFYITLAPTPFLDGDYSAFGVVESGMDVVSSIQIGDVIEEIIIE